jgi:hypothetical protein
MIVLFTWPSAQSEHSWRHQERGDVMTIPTNNTAWGFWGTIAHQVDPEAA